MVVGKTSPGFVGRDFFVDLCPSGCSPISLTSDLVGAVLQGSNQQARCGWDVFLRGVAVGGFGGLDVRFAIALLSACRLGMALAMG